MTECIVHIGLDKTGTTSLQGALSAAAPQLGRHGAIYPKAGRVHNHHMLLSQALGFSFQPLEDSESTNLRQQLLKEISGKALTPIFSSEHFCYNATPRNIEALGSLLSDYDVRIVIVVRNQIDWFISLFSEAIKWGHTADVGTYFDQIRWRLDYPKFIDRWADVFGRDRVSIHDYDRCDDVVAWFFNVYLNIGPKQLPPRNSDRANRSPSQVLLEAFRLANAKVSNRRDRVRFTRFEAAAQAYAVPEGHVWPIPVALRERIAGYEEENQRLVDPYGAENVPLFAYPLQHTLDRYQSRLLSPQSTAKDLAFFERLASDAIREIA